MVACQSPLSMFQKVDRRVLQLDMAVVYDESGRLASQQAALGPSGVGEQHGGVQGIVWTPSMRCMYTLLDRYPLPSLLS